LFKDYRVSRDAAIATGVGLLCGLGLGVMIVVGSRNLGQFDPALVAYTFATLFATFGIAYRYTIWLRKPPTWMYFKRGWQTFFRRDRRKRNAGLWVRRVVGGFALNDFIWRRGRSRWAAHWLIMWGCVTAAAITFPLVFGWVHFATPPDDFAHYTVYVFGFPTVTIAADGLFARFIFHGLVWSSFLVLPGVMLAMRRRMRDHGGAAVQRFGEDVLPLLMLFAITVTGLLLWVSYSWMHGYAYEFLAILHAATVIFTLLYMPFGKFFHIFQRPAQLGVSFYRDVGTHSDQALCRRCGQPFTSRMHVEDLIAVERQLGYSYEMPGTDAGHYQWICPKCRRSVLALAQGAAFEASEPWMPYLQKEPAGDGHTTR
jgi:hypothetical protein